MDAVRRQGTVGCLPASRPRRAGLDPNFIHYNEVLLTGPRTQHRPVPARARAAAHLDDLRQIVTHSFTVDDAPKLTRLERDGLKTRSSFQTSPITSSYPG